MFFNSYYLSICGANGRHLNPAASAIRNVVTSIDIRRPLFSSNQANNGIVTRNDIGPQFVKKAISPKIALNLGRHLFFSPSG